MTLLACIAAGLFGIVLSAMLRRLTDSLSSFGTDIWGYYFSGVMFALTLAVPLALTLTSAINSHEIVKSLSQDQLLGRVFPALELLLCMYLIVAKRLQLTSLNPVVMSLVCAVGSLAALAINIFFGQGYAVFEVIVLVATVVALLPSMVSLGEVHAKFNLE